MQSGARSLLIVADKLSEQCIALLLRNREARGFTSIAVRLPESAPADRIAVLEDLEILTGEVVGAGHASASGRLEDEHIFYLQARGIPLEEARRLVIRGFFGELIGKIGVPELEERIAAAIESELS